MPPAEAPSSSPSLAGLASGCLESCAACLALGRRSGKLDVPNGRSKDNKGSLRPDFLAGRPASPDQISLVDLRRAAAADDDAGVPAGLAHRSGEGQCGGDRAAVVTSQGGVRRAAGPAFPSERLESSDAPGRVDHSGGRPQQGQDLVNRGRQDEDDHPHTVKLSFWSPNLGNLTFTVRQPAR